MWKAKEMALEQLDVEHLFTLDLQVAEGAQIIKGGPHGTRIIAEVAGGTFTGERLNGTVVSPGGDWVTARAIETFSWTCVSPWLPTTTQ